MSEPFTAMCQDPLFTVPEVNPAPAQPRRARRPRLSDADAADLYRAGYSACQIADAWGLKRSGAEDKIRAAGLAGLVWCRIHRQLEELRNIK